MTDIIPQKRCPDCKQWYPATPEFFTRNRSTPSGLNAYCKECWNAKHRKYPIVIDNVPDGYKRCTICKEVFLATPEFFHRQSANKTWGLSPACKQCNHKMVNSHYRRNRDKLQTRHKAWQETNQERFTACKKLYRQTHKEQINARRKQYAAAYPEKGRIANRKRRALKQQAQGAHTAQDIQAQHDRQKGKCYYCHKKLTKYHVDHVIPLSRGGSNGSDNLVIACPTCNDSKGYKLPHEWHKGGRLL